MNNPIRPMKFVPLVLLLLLGTPMAWGAPAEKYKTIIDKWEPSIREFEELDRQNKYPPNSILFAGSSSIRLWDNIEQDMAPYAVIQRGYGGASYVDLDHYIDRIVGSHELAGLVLFAGNDIWGKDDDRTPAEIAGLLRDIVERVRKRHPSMPVFVVEITHVPRREHLISRITEENQELKAVCDQSAQVYWVATNDLYLTKDGKVNAAMFREDHLHQNQRGYQAWTDRIKEKIREVLSPTPARDGV